MDDAIDDNATETNATEVTPTRTTGVPTGATELSEVLDAAQAQGYSVEFEPAGQSDDELLCPSCSTSSPAPAFQREWSHRLEGVSDPADMLHVSALTCPRCGARGVFITPFGPAASDRQAAVLRSMAPAAGDAGEPVA